MSIKQIMVPSLGESVTEATIARITKNIGEAIKADELLIELETDKVTLEVNAPAAGVLSELAVKQGDVVLVGAFLGAIQEGAVATVTAKPVSNENKPMVAAPIVIAQTQSAPILSPAANKIAAEQGINPASLTGTGKDGRITKSDILSTSSHAVPEVEIRQDGREERVRMSRLRKTIATRLKESQNTAAMLTTFNEVDMSAVMALRNEYKEIFEKKHGVKMGFMSFFVKACIHALKEIPAVNAEIDGDDIIYKNYYDISVAVGTEQGLVTPVVRGAEQLSLAGIEKEIGNLGKKAREGKLTMQDLAGGTFTISNGGVYGSLMSTPIINPPQSAILGMHKTEERPVAINGKLEIRPMMYLAMSYDHRIIDGKEAVTFVVKVKEAIEDPRRLLLDL